MTALQAIDLITKNKIMIDLLMTYIDDPNWHMRE